MMGRMKSKERWLHGIGLLMVWVVVLCAGCQQTRPEDGVAAGDCIRNLKQIDHAKQVWALENGKAPSEMPKESELFGEGGYMQRKPGCPRGGVYTLGTVGELPKCSVKGHALQVERESGKWK